MSYKFIGIFLAASLVIGLISSQSYKYGYTVRDAEAKKHRLILINELNSQKEKLLNEQKELRKKESLKARETIKKLQQRHKVELGESISKASKNSNCKRLGSDVVELFKHMHDSRTSK